MLRNVYVCAILVVVMILIEIYFRFLTVFCRRRFCRGATYKQY